MPVWSILIDGSPLEVELGWSDSYDSVHEVIALYADAGLRRPLANVERMRCMLMSSNAFAFATIGGHLVGLARGLSDNAHVCYLADLAVLSRFQHCGIGRKIMEEFMRGVGESVTIVVHAAAGAAGFYERIGLERWQDVFRRPRRR